ncbi:MAG: site-specific integrase [Acidimicrobiia bacterium]|nr:site-specific integrase [Acidimicrobiia bacterium]
MHIRYSIGYGPTSRQLPHHGSAPEHPPPPPPQGQALAWRAEAVERLIARGKAAALAPNTRKAYRTGWKSWATWAADNGAAALPAAPGDLQRWLTHLWQDGKKPTTLRTYLAAVAHHHRDRPGDNPAKHPDVVQLMSGIARQAADDGYEPDQAEPLRWLHVQLIAQHTAQQLAQPHLPPQAKRRLLADLAMIAVGHDAALRSSELLALRWADVSRSDETKTGRVLIRRSKTDQTGQGAVCPISAHALQALKRIRPPNAQPHHRIFPISASTHRRRIKAAAQNAGIDPAGITTHSPRIGMAQDLAAAGADIAAIMVAGRWTQPATVARYIRNLTADHTITAQYLQTQDRSLDKATALRPLAEVLSGLAAMATRLHPTAGNTARKPLSARLAKKVKVGMGAAPEARG